MTRSAAEGYGHPLMNRPRPIVEPCAADYARVAGWRRLRMSWAHIARNLGVAEPDARRLFDPAFKTGEA